MEKWIGWQILSQSNMNLYRNFKTSHFRAQGIYRAQANNELKIVYPLDIGVEKEMAIHSRILAWKIPWMEEPGRLHTMGLQRVGQDWATSLSFLEIGLRVGVFIERRGVLA